MERYRNIKLIFITLGGDGSCAYCNNAKAKAPIYRVNTVEKTGAGDTFFGCGLNYILEHDIDSLNESRLTELLRFANAGASLITTKKGALKVMPDMQEISDLIGDEENV